MGYDENVLKADYYMFVPGEMDESIFDSKWVRMNQNFPNWMSTKSLQQKQIQNQIQNSKNKFKLQTQTLSKAQTQAQTNVAGMS